MFQKTRQTDKGRIYDKSIMYDYTWKTVLEYHGENTECYLSGEKINLFKDDYSFDHILPVSKGGDNSFENLGICTRRSNFMKSDMTPDELIEMCKKVLKHNGYVVYKNKSKN